jgi:DNA ligase-1
MPWKDGATGLRSCSAADRRKSLGGSILSDVPVVLVAYDLLELEGRDVRNEPLARRRAMLTDVIAASRSAVFIPSPVVPLASWADARSAYASARERCAEGLMLKRMDSAYGGTPEGWVVEGRCSRSR